ncbi:hypothetical protein A3D77_05870 [Candidatus Gottesmanbacteria bacterium RIFCSPHIGHO2_02_FULL_39_11]|uniref:AbiEi antitoxin C-terminal domain-containing protein n=1 Tax=Candidatus Gottesmanbacteria bacterium RIFCSPHIGHO2_02_FULL_39_11 TaxID=1798382 RepID=A0A1F5ZTV1_9BACT|nr:MAG: hypothetical protein A3D77_05870 [Candidatus Gottesmanbacteria bacterium RIFCSPHIGHO2_02_FULL_39_11]
MENDLILQLYKKPETVFSIHEISQIFPSISLESLRDRLYYFTKAGKIKHPHHGIYTKETYSPLELANKIYTPSYISLETVLSLGGMVFQHYERIFAVSYLTRSITVEEAKIQYRRIRKDILTNMEGIEPKTGHFIASLERAFLDAVYIYKNYHFDNLSVLNWEKTHEIMEIYKSAILEKRVDWYYKQFKEDYNEH